MEFFISAFALETVCIVHFSVWYSATWYYTVFIGTSCIAMCCCNVSVSVVSELDLVELEIQMHPPLDLAEEM